MERSIISWNVPNLITVPLMAFGGFLLLSIIWQFVGRVRTGGANGGWGLSAGGSDA